MIQQLVSKLQHSINLKIYDPNSAIGMAVWASDLNLSFKKACERADRFGNYLIHHEDMDEAKAALIKYTETIARASFLPRWVRRDILFKASQHFIEPDFECFANEVYGVEEDDALFNQMMAYHAADAETRIKLRSGFTQDILEMLDGYYESAEHYQQRQRFIMELKEIENMIECEKYGI